MKIIGIIALSLTLAACGATTGAYKPGQINVANVDANGKLYYTQINPSGSTSSEPPKSLSTYDPFTGGFKPGY